jgi:phospholipid:diacylglycerol acyltransferase
LPLDSQWMLINRADHVDILGATPLNEAIVKIAAGRGDLVTDQIDSGILEYVEKMKWD